MVWQTAGTGTLTIIRADAEGSIDWKVTARMEGKASIKDAPGQYRDHGSTQCVAGACAPITDASSPIFNPLMWGFPAGKVTTGMSWEVELPQPWELGPPGKQRVTVVSADEKSGTIVLQREGSSSGSYQGARDSTVLKKGNEDYHMTIKRGAVHWNGQAITRHGVVLSDELFSTTAVTLTAPGLGTVSGEERQYMSLVQHPESIPE